MKPRWLGLLFLVAFCHCSTAAERSVLPKRQYRSGSEMLQAATPVTDRARASVVKLDIDGNTVALGTVIRADGLVITKASELRSGALTAWLPGGREVPAEWLRTDEENDVALVRVRAAGLKPIRWSSHAPRIGQWVITPGPEQTPLATGIVSTEPRKILHKRALIGVELDFEASAARIARVMPGYGAENAGLKPGDVVLAVNGGVVSSSAELTKTLREFREGQNVVLRVQRAREEFEAKVAMTVPKPDTTNRRADRAELMNHLGSTLSSRAEGFGAALQHDTVLQAWQCGGPLIDIEGNAIGLNIARAGRVASYALPAYLARQIASDLIREMGDVPQKQKKTGRR